MSSAEIEILSDHYWRQRALTWRRVPEHGPARAGSSTASDDECARQLRFPSEANKPMVARELLSLFRLLTELPPLRRQIVLVERRGHLRQEAHLLQRLLADTRQVDAGHDPGDVESLLHVRPAHVEGDGVTPAAGCVDAARVPEARVQVADAARRRDDRYCMREEVLGSGRLELPM